MVHHALETQPIAVGIGGVIEAGQTRRSLNGAGTIVTTAIVLGHDRIVVAGPGVRASTEFILITDTVTIGIVVADTVTIHIGRRRIGAGTVLDVGLRIVDAGRRIKAPPIDAAAIVHRGKDLEVQGRWVHTTEVNAGAVLVVGAGIEVVRRAGGAAGGQAGPIVHVRRLVIVGGAGIDAPAILARFVIDVGVGVVVHCVRIQTSREQASAIVVIGPGIKVGR